MHRRAYEMPWRRAGDPGLTLADMLKESHTPAIDAVHHFSLPQSVGLGSSNGPRSWIWLLGPVNRLAELADESQASLRGDWVSWRATKPRQEPKQACRPMKSAGSLHVW